MRPSSFQGKFSWPLFIVFLVFFFPWGWYTGKSIQAVLFHEKTVGIIQDESYIPPTNTPSVSEQPASQIGTYTHQAIFTTQTGATHQVFTRVHSNPPPFKIGDRVPIYFDAHNPSNAMIGTFSELWLPPLSLSFFTLIFFVLWLGAWIEPINGLPRTINASKTTPSS